MRLGRGPNARSYSGLFRRQTEIVVEAANVMASGLQDYGDPAGLADKLATLRLLGQDAERATLARLTRSFITPFDRDGSYEFATHLSDIGEMIEHTASRLSVYGVMKPPIGSADQASLVARACAIVLGGVEQLSRKRTLSVRPELARLDTEGFELLRRLMANLLTTHGDVYSVLIGFEVHRGLQKTLRAVVRIGPVLERLARSHGPGTSW